MMRVLSFAIAIFFSIIIGTMIGDMIVAFIYGLNGWER